MSEFKGTKGPWCFKREDDDTDNGGLYNLEGNLVCHFGDSEQYYPTDGVPPDEDDMTLITAAPDLLEAMQNMVTAYEYEASIDNPALLAARAAIAKALGETK